MRSFVNVKTTSSTLCPTLETEGAIAAHMQCGSSGGKRLKVEEQEKEVVGECARGLTAKSWESGEPGGSTGHNTAMTPMHI